MLTTVSPGPQLASMADRAVSDTLLAQCGNRATFYGAAGSHPTTRGGATLAAAYAAAAAAYVAAASALSPALSAKVVRAAVQTAMQLHGPASAPAPNAAAKWHYLGGGPGGSKQQPLLLDPSARPPEQGSGVCAPAKPTCALAAITQQRTVREDLKPEKTKMRGPLNCPPYPPPRGRARTWRRSPGR